MFTHIFCVNGNGLTVQIARVVRDIFHQAFQHGMQTTRTDVFGGFVHLPCGLGNTFDTVFGELEVHAFGRHQRFVLNGCRGVWLGQDTFEVFGRQRLQLNADRQTALQFRDQIRRAGNLEGT